MVTNPLVQVYPQEAPTMRHILAFVLALSLSILSCASDPNVEVWVNTDSGIYHCPGTKWYGKTKQGRYIKQKEAQSAGYKPASGKVCT